MKKLFTFFLLLFSVLIASGQNAEQKIMVDKSIKGDYQIKETSTFYTYCDTSFYFNKNKSSVSNIILSDFYAFHDLLIFYNYSFSFTLRSLYNSSLYNISKNISNKTDLHNVTVYFSNGQSFTTDFGIQNLGKNSYYFEKAACLKFILNLQINYDSTFWKLLLNYNITKLEINGTSIPFEEFNFSNYIFKMLLLRLCHEELFKERFGAFLIPSKPKAETKPKSKTSLTEKYRNMIRMNNFTYPDSCSDSIVEPPSSHIDPALYHYSRNNIRGLAIRYKSVNKDISSSTNKPFRLHISKKHLISIHHGNFFKNISLSDKPNVRWSTRKGAIDFSLPNELSLHKEFSFSNQKGIFKTDDEIISWEKKYTFSNKDDKVIVLFIWNPSSHIMKCFVKEMIQGNVQIFYFKSENFSDWPLLKSAFLKELPFCGTRIE